VQSGREYHPDHEREIGANIAKGTRQLIPIEANSAFACRHIYIVRLYLSNT
jgi:hypothetical protein